jgi:hypothetical protein
MQVVQSSHANFVQHVQNPPAQQSREMLAACQPALYTLAAKHESGCSTSVQFVHYLQSCKRGKHTKQSDTLHIQVQTPACTHTHATNRNAVPMAEHALDELSGASSSLLKSHVHQLRNSSLMNFTRASAAQQFFAGSHTCISCAKPFLRFLKNLCWISHVHQLRKHPNLCAWC